MFSLRICIIDTCKVVVKRKFSSQKGAVTALYDFHVKNGGKMVNFGGYLLPVQYSDQSIVNSHLFTRKNASMFDVSHMLQTEIRAPRNLCLLRFKEKRVKQNQSLLLLYNREGYACNKSIVHFFSIENDDRKNKRTKFPFIGQDTGQFTLQQCLSQLGKNCMYFLESVCTADIKGLDENTGVLTVFTNKNGGILDDLIVTKINDEYLYVVSNAAMKVQDQKIMMTALENYKKQHDPSSDVQIKFFETLERTLIALQGPKAANALQKLTQVDLTTLYFMTTTVGTVGNVGGCRITRCGYTGEDGFEISIPAEKSEEVVKLLLENADVKLAGLGARDSLRLEAGLCLYGNDLTPDTTPVEGALTWLVAKRRRELKNFPGAEKILQQIKESSKIKRIGITSTTGPPPRQGAKILSEDGRVLGDVTSGCPSPSLGVNVAMGYVSTEHSKAGTKLGLQIRDKVYQGIVTKMPFVKANYYNKPK